MDFWRSIQDKRVVDRIMDEQAHELAAQEINSGMRRDGLWAKAIVEAGPDERLAKVAYLRLLVQRIKDEAHLRERAEEQEREASYTAAARAAQAEQSRQAQAAQRQAQAAAQAAADKKVAEFLQARRERILRSCAALKQADLDFQDYELLVRADRASIRFQGFIVGAYYYEKCGKTVKINRYKELRPWFLSNVVPKLEATI